ncbi:MAG TPA: hypothetical protein VLA55_01470 [Ornithinibacter sp.]|nr:hypothetical protein [Ornithinibacter sp.]
MSGVNHPEVEQWLARLEAEAAVLPEDRRVELRASIDEHLADAVGSAPHTDAAVRRTLAALGDPADMVAEAGGYAVAPEVEHLTADPFGGDVTGTPWLEVVTITLLAASVVLALIPATSAFAPLPWLVGCILVLLSRRWGAADKALAVVAYGVLGVPLLLLGRDELPTSSSLLVSVALAALWLFAATRLLLRARSPIDQGRGLRMS